MPDVQRPRTRSGRNSVHRVSRGAHQMPAGPQWGLHLLDANIALGNLVGIVGRDAAAYRG
jgi:hypothetical protein